MYLFYIYLLGDPYNYLRWKEWGVRKASEPANSRTDPKWLLVGGDATGVTSSAALCGVPRQSLRILRNSESNHVHTWKPALDWPILSTLKPHHHHAFIISLAEISKLFCRNPTYLSSETLLPFSLLGPLFSPELPFFQPWDREAWDDHTPRTSPSTQAIMTIALPFWWADKPPLWKLCFINL